MLKDVFVKGPEEVLEGDVCARAIATLDRDGTLWWASGDRLESLDSPFYWFPKGFTVKREVGPAKVVVDGLLLEFEDDTPQHGIVRLLADRPYPEFAPFDGKRVRVTIEAVGDE